MSLWQGSLLVFFGSGLGGVGRYLLLLLLERRIDDRVDASLLATFAANLLGSLLIGAIFAACERDWLKLLLMTGVMGGFTTFSAFSLQTVDLLFAGAWPKAAGYAALSVLLCVLGAGLGIAVGRSLA